MNKRIILKRDLSPWLDGDPNVPDDFDMPEYFQAPISLVWELTAKCQSGCIYCSGGFPRKTKELPAKEKYKLADELIGMKIFMICLSGGDPLLCEETPILVRKFTEAGIPVMICTPGLCYQEKLIQELCRNAMVAFNISLDSVHADTNDFQRGVKGAGQKAMELMKKIGDYGKGETYLSVETVVTKKNYPGIGDTIKQLADFQVHELRIQPVIAMNKQTYESGLALNREEISGIESQIEQSVKSLGHQEESKEMLCVRFVDQSRAVIKGIRTGRNWGGIVSPEGNLMLNGYIPFIYGNLSNYTGFQQAWDSGFRNGWSDWKLKEALKQIKDVFDLQELYKERNFKRGGSL